MPKIQAVTCQIRYTLDLSKLDAFESYARVPLCLVGRLYGHFDMKLPDCRSPARNSGLHWGSGDSLL
jgi:hypothetical protein